MIILIITLIVVLLIVIIGALVIFSAQKKQIEYYKLLSKNLSAMNVIQNMLEIMSLKVNAEDKIKSLNDVILTTYGCKYSTICIYDGNNYEIGATNVEDTYRGSIKEIAIGNDFSSNVVKNISKYLTTSPSKTLTYKSAIERKIRSAMFSPIYCNGVYLGFWILEDTNDNAFDSISKSELSKLKLNLGVFIDNVQFQGTIEKAENTDKQTGYYNTLYLYSGARQKLKNNENNALALICLKNLPDINEKYGRNIGNSLLVKIANSIKNTVPNSSILIRYSGIRLLVIVPNSTAESIQPTIERMMSRFKDEIEYVEDTKVTVDAQALLHTFKNQNNIDTEMNKMINYIEKMQDINTIKII